MIKTKLLPIAAGLAAGALLAASPANAQVRVRIGGHEHHHHHHSDGRSGVRTGVRVGAHYRYRGYDSGRWYAYERRHHRRHRWNAEYRGYDCYRAFRYDWDRGDRVRYDSYWCYDGRNRPYEARGARVMVRID